MKKIEKQDKIFLTVEKRTILGRKSKKMRFEGILPGNVFGTSFKSLSVSCNQREFLRVYKSVKNTGVVYLKVDTEELPVLISSVQRHPVSDQFLHVDFRKIDLTQKVTTQVPVQIIGSSIAVTQKGGVLLTQTELVMVEALPQNIPQHMVVDISTITEIGTEITVGNLPKSDKYLVKDDPKKVIVSVVAHKEESITPETTTAAPEVITEKLPSEQTTGEGESTKTVAAPEASTAPKK